MKPANILVTGNGNVKLSDFGILESLQDEDLCTTVMGIYFSLEFSTVQKSANPFFYQFGNLRTEPETDI